MSKYAAYVGLGLTRASVICQALNAETGETNLKAFGDCPSAEVIASWLSTLERPVYCAYEPGCTAK